MFWPVRWIIVFWCFLGISCEWQSVFNYHSCYETRMNERMPLSIDNLIALIEKFERAHAQTSPEQIAEAILYRYRTNGVVFDPDSQYEWSTHQLFEFAKQDLDDNLLKPGIETPIDSFFPREECSIHLSVSHSTDLYPHAGVDASWENQYNYRKKRAVNGESSNYNYGVDIHETATHPIEFGVIQSASGPIATGLLLSGIMTMYESRSYTVSELIGKDNVNSYMPPEMMSKRIDQLYGSTLSGKLGQSAILSYKSGPDNNFEIGPIGRFGNCTSCPRIFSLQDADFSYFSRAEVFSSVDGMIIAKTLRNRGDSRTLKLSQILRMYYSEHGLFNEEIRACNRHNIFNTMKANNMDEIKSQALNYMYAYQAYFPNIKEMIKMYKDDYEMIERTFTRYLDDVVSEFERFLSSYSYEDPNVEPCPSYDDRDPKLESESDLVVVFTPIGSQDDVEKQAQYISATARKIGVGYHRSRMAIFNGRTMNWITPMVNYSNIADYSCNYTTFMSYGTTSSQDFIRVLDELSMYYNKFYNYMKGSDDHTGSRNHVVMWNLPNNFITPSDEFAAQDAWNKFNMSYPDVNFIFVGEELEPIFSDVFWGGENRGQDDEKVVVVSNTQDDALEIAYEIVSHIKKVPRMFIFPGCDTSNSSYENYKESSHRYVNYVTPNYTTVIRIPPQNFHYSEFVKLKFENSQTDICVSRINLIPSRFDSEDETTCLDGSSGPEFEQYFLCDRYVEDCLPIYISVMGKTSSVNKHCSDEQCKFPNQVKFVMTHEGMICGCWALLPTPLLLIIVVLLQYFKF